MKASNLSAYNLASDDDKFRSVLDYSATNFLTGGWNATQFMSPNIQNVQHDPSNPSSQFPRDFYDGNFVVPSGEWVGCTTPECIDEGRFKGWQIDFDRTAVDSHSFDGGPDTADWRSGLQIWPNHTGITMEMWQMREVRVIIA